MCPAFDEIGEEFGSIDLALIPIGAYEPRETLRFQHINPEEALEIHRKVHAEWSIGMHYGAFRLSRDGPLGAMNAIRDLSGEEKFITIPIGDSFDIKD
jgi:L-ascorbate metabolism protein UlaG (beta-lactamase superfamily)